MLNNGYFAPLKLLYKEIWNYKDKSKNYWKNSGLYNPRKSPARQTIYKDWLGCL